MEHQAVTMIPLGRIGDISAPWHLFPLPIVESQLRRLWRTPERPEVPDESRGLELQLERLPYCIGGAYWAVMEIRHLLAKTSDAHRQEFMTSEATQFVLETAETLFIRHAVDSYLDIACRAQDAVLAYVSATYKVSLPKSLSKCITALEKGKIALAPEIAAAAAEYWSSTGQRLRQYRDLAQHHAVVASEGTLIKTEGGTIEVSLTLPANPEVKSPKEWNYGSGAELACPFCERSFLELFTFIYRTLFILARELGFTNAFTRRVTFRAPMGPVVPPGHAIPSPEEIGDRLMELRRTLKEQCQAEYGAFWESPG